MRPDIKINGTGCGDETAALAHTPDASVAAIPAKPKQPTFAELGELRGRAYVRMVSKGAFVLKENFIPFSGEARDRRRRILHIAPFSYFDPRFYFLGSTKDHDCRQEYLRQCGVAFDTFAHLKNRQSLENQFSFFNLPDYSHIILDISQNAKELEFLKRRWPNARLIVRSHNPEVLHRIHYNKAAQLYGDNAARKTARGNLIEYTFRERAVARLADTVLHIESDETLGYWRWLGLKGEASVAPYFLTENYLSLIPPGARKKKQILCLSSSHPGPLISDLVANLHRTVKALGDRLADFDFLATGNVPKNVAPIIDLADRVIHLGYVNDIMKLQAESFALIVPTELGRGFKTKILDAIVCGAWVIAPPALLKRMPDQLRKYCEEYSLTDPGPSLERAVRRLESRTWPAGDPNSELQAQTYAALDQAILS